jgi:flagellar biosynthesis protein FlhF
MVVKKLYGKSMKDVLGQAKAKMGEDVVILSQKTLPGGEIELTVAMDPPQGGRQYDTHGFEEEISEIKQMLLSLVEERGVMQLGKAALFLYHELKQKGLSEKIACQVVQGLAQGLGPEDLMKRDVLEKELRRFFFSRITTTQPLTEEKMCIGLLGRTGVGKTTTLAKLASMERFNRRRRVGLVSLDGEKVASGEELQRIGKILDVPIAIAYERSQVPKIVELGERVDTLLVDTPGKGLKETGLREKLFDMMTLCPHAQFHLLLSPHYRREVLLEDLEEYGRLTLNSLILTKVDENRRVGGVMDAVLSHPIPLSWMTTGHDILHDILPVNKGMLVDMMMEA